jgi:hypothetical protein
VRAICAPFNPRPGRIQPDSTGVVNKALCRTTSGIPLYERDQGDASGEVRIPVAVLPRPVGPAWL